MNLTCRVIESGIELTAVVEYALKLIARSRSVRELDLTDELARHRMNCDHAVLLFALEAAHIIDVVADAVHALIEKGGLFAFEFDILLRIQIAVENDHVVVIAEPSYIAVFLGVVSYCSEALVFAPDRFRQLLDLAGQLDVFIRSDGQLVRIDENGSLVLDSAASRNEKILSRVECQAVCMIDRKRGRDLDDLSCAEIDLDYLAVLDIPVVQGEICISRIGACALKGIVSIELLACG